MKRAHVIPVPQRMTPDEAWAEIRTMGRLVDPRCHEPLTWAVFIEEA